MALTIDRESAAAIPALVAARAQAEGARVILRRKHRGLWQAVSWAELAQRMRAMARALQAAGVARGDSVCVLSATRLEWVYADLGVLAAGGVCVGIDPDAEVEQAAHILRKTRCRVLFVENEEQLDKTLAATGSCPALQRIVIFDMAGLRELGDPRCESLSVFLARTEGEAAAAADPVGVAAIPPEIAETVARLGLRHGDERLAFLPMSDALERVSGLYLALASGTVSNYIENADTLFENLREVQPTVLSGTPQFWQRLHARAVAEIAGATRLQRRACSWALGRGLRPWLARRVLNRLRRALGLARLRVACLGAGTIPAETSRWLAALGIDLVGPGRDGAREPAAGEVPRDLAYDLPSDAREPTGTALGRA